MTVKEAASEAGVSIQVITYHIRNRNLIAKRVGKIYKIQRANFDSWMKAQGYTD